MEAIYRDADRKTVLGLALLIILLLASGAQGQYWTWTQPAEHHEAEVKILCREGNGFAKTSGTYIQYGDLVGVLTCAHGLMTREAEVEFSDGTKQVGVATTCRFQHDVGFVRVTHPTIKPLEVATNAPAPGDQVEFVTYGGPAEKTLRHFLARVETVGGETIFDAHVMHGDSGGGILNMDHQVVAVQSCGRDTVASNPPVYRGSTSAGFVHITAFLDRICTTNQLQCPGGQCQPYAPAPRGGGQYYPPQQPRAPAPYQPPMVPVVPQPQPSEIPGIKSDIDSLKGRVQKLEDRKWRSCECDPKEPAEPAQPKPEKQAACPVIDYDAIAGKVFERFKAKAGDFRGPAGPPGPAGSNGKDGAPGKDATPVEPVTEARVKHIVIVADQSSATWSRLKGEIENAQTAYHGIRVSELPKFPIGPIPQAVLYEGGIPVKVYKGQREVSELLVRIYRGDFQ